MVTSDNLSEMAHPTQPQHPTTLSIGQLADAAGVPIDTVRYYMRRGLLDEPGRTRHGHRRFDSDDAARLHFVVRAKAHGFTLAEIKELWSLLGDDATTCADVRGAIEQAAARHREVIVASQRALDRMDAMLESCACDGPASRAGADAVSWVPNPDDPEEGIRCDCSCDAPDSPCS